MTGRIERLWPRRPADSEAAGGEAASADTEAESGVEPPADVALSTERAAAPLEQPVLLTPVGATRQVHVGDVLPPARRGWPGPLARLPLPMVPKRAILAAGVCAGLVAPTLARHLASRMLAGPSANPIGTTLEITKIVYNGPLTADAVSNICKALISAGRR
jgi:hypothetical protein